MRKLTALFVASTLALGAANLAHAADTTTAAPAAAKPMLHHKGKFGPHQDMMFKDLNLTDAQKQQIREIMKGQRDQMKRPPLEERRARHTALYNIIAANDIEDWPAHFLKALTGSSTLSPAGSEPVDTPTLREASDGYSAAPLVLNS